MEEEGIGLVLARATELRMKISNCIDKATTPRELQNNSPPGDENGVSGEDEAFGGQEEEDEEAHRLFNICDALESLETQLSSLQVCCSKFHFFRLGFMLGKSSSFIYLFIL